jgi:NAD(P)H dehydrogenase (quinone)
MKYLIVYAHPNLKSFNHAIREIIEDKLRNDGMKFDVRDLYEINFNPALSGSDFVSFKQGVAPADIKGEQEYVKNADVLIFIYPIWWFGMPAILKGYIDRVFSYGFAYKADEKGLHGLLSDKKIIIFNTTGGSQEDYELRGYKDALKKITEIGTLNVCGLKVILHKYFHAVTSVSNETRAKMLEDLKAVLLQAIS